VNSLLPPNATPMERAFAQVCAELLSFATPLATLANPDTIPAKFLPWLAWSLGVRSWKPYWSEAIKRSRVRHALAIARQQGTAQSVEDVVASFGGHVVVRPWFEQEPEGEPFTFQLTLTLTDSTTQDTSAAFVDDVIAEVSRTKSARDHFTFTQGLNARAGVGVMPAVRAMAYAHLQFAGAA
jgi:phage tail P2-like protein